MQIAAITQQETAGWPVLKWGPLAAGVNAVYGPPRSGKSTLANLLAHALFGKTAVPATLAAPSATVPGDVFVESDQGRHRLRLARDERGAPRLTVAALDGSAVDAGTMRRLVGGLSPAVLTPLCAVDFREAPDIAWLLSADFARGFQSIGGGSPTHGSRRTAELAARRDLLAQELETRIAGERQQSKDLEARCRELDRLLRNEQEQVTAIEQSLRAAETALAETDGRLRYRRLELHVARQRQTTESRPGEVAPDDLDEHLARVRSMLAELARREANVRARLAPLQASQSYRGTAHTETQVWLAVGRQLAADLAGEVARLARASASQQCLCRDAHPRLRPISEAIERQLDVLATLFDEQQQSFAAVELQHEIDHLARSQTDLQQHVDQLLSRRLRECGAAADRPEARNEPGLGANSDAVAGPSSFGAADVEQLESRRSELEQQRFQLIERLRSHGRTLRDLRAQRETVDRQRAGLLSARSIEHVQRELTNVQQKLEQATSLCGNSGDLAMAEENPARASDFLAQLTDGGLVRLMLVEQGRRACVVDREGRTLGVESLTAAQRDQVYLSLCLALVSSAWQEGVRLPLVLDEPFERLDARDTAALAAVLDDFGRRGHQVVVFTGRPAAAERLASVGAAVHDIARLRKRENHPAALTSSVAGPRAKKRTKGARRRKSGKQSAGRRANSRNNDPSGSERSDAA